MYLATHPSMPLSLSLSLPLPLSVYVVYLYACVHIYIHVYIFSVWCSRRAATWKKPHRTTKGAFRIEQIDSHPPAALRAPLVPFPRSVERPRPQHQVTLSERPRGDRAGLWCHKLKSSMGFRHGLPRVRPRQRRTQRVAMSHKLATSSVAAGNSLALSQAMHMSACWESSVYNPGSCGEIWTPACFTTAGATPGL